MDNDLLVAGQLGMIIGGTGIAGVSLAAKRVAATAASLVWLAQWPFCEQGPKDRLPKSKTAAGGA